MAPASLTSPRPQDPALPPPPHDGGKSESWTTTDFNSSTTTPDSRPHSGRGTRQSSPILTTSALSSTAGAAAAAARGRFLLGDDHTDHDSHGSLAASSTDTDAAGSSSSDSSSAELSTPRHPRGRRQGKRPEPELTHGSTSRLRRPPNRRRKSANRKPGSRGPTTGEPVNGEDHDDTSLRHPPATNAPAPGCPRSVQFRPDDPTSRDTPASWSSSVASSHRPPLLMKAVAAPAAVMSNLAVSASSQIVPSATVTTQNAHGVNARFTNDHVPSPVPSAPVEATTAVSADPLPLATPPSGRRRSALHRQASDSARATPKSVRFSPQPVRSVIPGRTATGSPTRRSGTPGSSGDPAKETERPPAFVAEPLLTYAPRAPLQRHRGRTDKQSAERVRYLAENPHYIYHPDNQQRSERAILEAELEVSTVTQFVNPLVAAHCRLRIRATDGVSYRALSMGVEGVRPGATRSGVVNNRYSTGALAAGVVETALSANDPAHRVEALVDAAPTPAQTPPAARLYRILPPAYLLPLANHACLTMRCANLGDVLHDPTLLIAAADQSYMHHLEETLVPPPHPRTPGPEALRHYSEGHVSHALTSLSTLDSAGVRKSYPFKPTVVPTYLAGHVAAAVGGHYLFESTEPSAVTVSSAVTRQAVHSALGGTHELVPTPLVLPSHQLAAINPWGNADTLYTTSAEVLVLPEGAEIRAHWRMEGQPYGFSLEPGRADRGHWWDLPSHPRRGHTVADGFRPADREDDLDTKHRRRLAFLDALPNPRNNQGYPQHCVVAFYAQNITPLYPKYGLDPALRRHHPQLKTRRVQAVRDRLRAQSKDRELDTYARNMAIPAGLGYHATTMV